MERQPITRSVERDNYIMAQALYVAIREMKKVPEEMREVSNIRDMELILETAFPQFAAVIQAQDRGRN